jgi:hypothetical protein
VIEGLDLQEAFWGQDDRPVTQLVETSFIDVKLFEDPLPAAIGQFIESPAEHIAADLVVDEPVEPEFPAVDPAVEEPALGIASQIWSVGSLPRDQLFQGMNQSIAEQYLAHAEAMEWLIIADGQVRPGAVDPRPRAVTLIPN